MGRAYRLIWLFHCLLAKIRRLPRDNSPFLFDDITAKTKPMSFVKSLLQIVVCMCLGNIHLYVYIYMYWNVYYKNLLKQRCGNVAAGFKQTSVSQNVAWWKTATLVTSRWEKGPVFTSRKSAGKKNVRRSKEISGSFDAKENMFTNEVWTATRWWFQNIFYFHPYLGKTCAYFSNGWVETTN